MLWSFNMIHLYRHFDSTGVLLYVGISKSTIARLSQHKRTANWYDDINSITIEHFLTMEEARQAETNAILTEHPLFNVVHNKTTEAVRNQLNYYGVLVIETNTPLKFNANVLCSKFNTSGIAHKLINGKLAGFCMGLLAKFLINDSSIIKAKVSDIQVVVGFTETTVLRYLKLLEDLTYIKNIGKSTYYLSPRLAFYGSSIEWSLALQYEEEGKTPEAFRLAKISINKQIKENETLAGIQQ
jgi:hypothetical protein